MSAFLRQPAERWVLLCVVGLVFAFGIWSWARFESEADHRAEESTIRVHQTCTLFESDHLADVRTLRRTYRYLVAQPGLSGPLNQAILQNLPSQEREARIDAAPPYCDEGGLGLPEPDPVVPERPEALRAVLDSDRDR